MKTIVLFFFIITMSVNAQVADKRYPMNVGDLNLEENDIKVCDTSVIAQYYETSKGYQYKGDKIEVIRQFNKNYHPKNISTKGQSGYITIRFLVNCEGKTGLFRIEEMSMDYKPFKFDKNIVSQLLGITKSLDGWVIGDYKGRIFDYYQYLTFKIDNSNLLEILP